VPTKSVLAIDVGTSVIKATLFADSGEILSRGSETVEKAGGGYVDPNSIWEITARVIQSSRRLNGVDLPVDSVIVTGQGDGLWMLETGNKVPAKAYLWNSSAGAEVIQSLESDGTIQKHFEASGNVLWSGCSVALWMWFKQTQSEAAQRTTTIFNAKDFINFKLTDKIATDLTDASIPFANPKTGKYSDEAFDLLNASDMKALAPEILPAGDLIGTITPEAASLTGLDQDTQVYMGVLDVVAMLFGSGLKNQGDVLTVLGTTAASISIVPSHQASRAFAGATIYLDDLKTNFRVMGSSSGTATLDWYMKNLSFLGENRYQELWDEINDSKPSNEVFLPFLNGERAPFLAPKATGSLLGITAETTRGAIARAVVEGITMSLNHGIQVAAEESNIKPGGALTLCGGGSASQQWAQLVANVTGCQVRVDNRPDVGAIGVASLLLPKVSVRSEEFLTQEKTYLPNQDYALMQEKYSRYLKYVNMFREIW
jgi:sugar (pentulose or hexulose) kinase